jgi:hypothetical protein
LLPYLAFLVIRLFSGTATGLTELFSGGFRDIRDEFESRQLEREIAAQVSKKQAASRQSRFFDKKTEGQDIFAAGAVLKDAMISCCETQHFAAEVLNVEHMSEVEDHVICQAFRSRVLDTTDYVLALLASRNIVKDGTAAKMAIGLSASRQICADCMLLKVERRNAPLLCDPARFLGAGEGEQKKGRK